LDGIRNIDILKNIYQSIDCFSLFNKVFLIYKLNLKDGEPVNKNIQAHVMMLDLNDFEGKETSYIEDVVADIIEMNTSVVVKDYRGKDEEFKSKVHSIIEDFGMKFSWSEFNFDKEIDLTSPTYNEMQIINEIFEEPIKGFAFSSRNFLLKYSIDEGGQVFYKNKKVLDLKESQFVELLFTSNDEIPMKIEKELQYYNKNSGLTTKFYEPFVFLPEDEDVNSKILKYKYKVFETLKNISPDMYPKIPAEVAEVLNKNGYIQLNDIMEIIGG